MAILASLALLPGCHHDTDDSAPPPLVIIHDDVLPSNIPAPSPLFAAATPSASAQEVMHAVYPPPTADYDRAAQQAVLASAAPLPFAAGKGGLQPGSIGLLVCDPVPAPASSPALANFGTGCGHWLHMTAAGRPELGQTPLWASRYRVEEELGRKDLCLGTAELASLPNIIGITHAASGTIAGTPAHCILTYQLYSLPDCRPLGAPLLQTGTIAQIAAALPSIARTLDARLGLASSPTSTLPMPQPNDLTWLGKVSHDTTFSDADLLALAHISNRTPLAGMFLLETRAIQDQIVLNRTVKTLMSQMPDNALVISQIGYVDNNALRPYAPQLSRMFARFPQNALLAHTEVWSQRIWGSRMAELAAARRTVADSPRDPTSWLTPAETLSNIAQDLRQCRLGRDITPQEWVFLKQLYSQAEADVLEATRLDTKDGHAWNQLAEDATFANDQSRAEEAFWQAQRLDTYKAEVYSWGLEMFERKWGGDPATLDKVAGLAAAQAYDDANTAIDIAGELKQASDATNDPKYNAMAMQVMTRRMDADRLAIRLQPGDAIAHWDLAAALAHSKDMPSLREATLEYRIAAHLLPNAPKIHYELADTLDQRHKATLEIAELRRAIALDPYYTKAHFDLGYVLKHQGHFAEATSEMRLAMRLDPRDADTHYGLGEVLSMQGHHAAACVEFREAVRLSPYFVEAWNSLCSSLDEAKQYDGSIQAGQKALQADALNTPVNAEFEANIHDTMADDYLHKKAWSDSLAESQNALALNANDALAPENIAEAYLGEGHLAEAKAQWEHVVALGDPRMMPIAQKYLASHH